MYTITKQFEFSASHQLDHLRNPDWPADDPRQHQCSRDHGHNYIVEVELAAEKLDDKGFVVDYGELRALKEHIDTKFDHRRLNEVFAGYTTAENLAHYFYRWCAAHWPQTVAVRVSETAKTWAEFRPGQVVEQIEEVVTTTETEETIEISIDLNELARQLAEEMAKRISPWRRL